MLLVWSGENIKQPYLLVDPGGKLGRCDWWTCWKVTLSCPHVRLLVIFHQCFLIDIAVWYWKLRQSPPGKRDPTLNNPIHFRNPSFCWRAPHYKSNSCDLPRQLRRGTLPFDMQWISRTPSPLPWCVYAKIWKLSVCWYLITHKLEFFSSNNIPKWHVIPISYIL